MTQPWQLWVQPPADTTNEQTWAADLDTALHRGRVGLLVQEDPPHDTSYVRCEDGFEVRVSNRDGAYDEVVRALPYFGATVVRPGKEPTT